MANMARICFSLPVQQEINTKTVDGYTKYTLSGFSSEVSNELIGLFDKIFLNRTYYFTTSVADCQQRLSNNESDFSSIFAIYDWPIPGTRVSAPVNSIQVSMMSAYNLQEIEEENSASALDNFGLFDSSIYLLIASFLAAMTILILASVTVNRHHCKMRKKLMWSEGRANQQPRQKRDAFEIVRGGFRRELTSVLLGTSERFRWLSFLCSLLSFMLVAALYGVYSTSQIIVKEPERVETYQQLIDHSKALPIFYEILGSVSEHFEDDPIGSPRRRVWQKLIKSGKNLEGYVIKKTSSDVRAKLISYFERMQNDGSILISSGQALRLLGGTICGSSPENELWHLKMFAEPSELESLVGWPIAADFVGQESVAKVIHRITESAVLKQMERMGLDASYSIGWLLSGTSKAHKMEQALACWASYSPMADPSFQNSFGYYESLSLLIVCLFVAAFFALCTEVSIAVLGKKKRRRHSY